MPVLCLKSRITNPTYINFRIANPEERVQHQEYARFGLIEVYCLTFKFKSYVY